MSSKPSTGYLRTQILHIEKSGAGSRNPKEEISLYTYCHGYSMRNDLYE